MKYIKKQYNTANTEIILLRKYVFLLQLVSTFDISIVECFDGLRQYLCAALYHLCLLSQSNVLLPLTDYCTYHWYFRSRFSDNSPISHIKHVFLIFNPDMHSGIEK